MPPISSSRRSWASCGAGRGDAPADRSDQPRVHQRRVGLRAVARGSGCGCGTADHVGAGQRTLPEMRRGAGAGVVAGDRTVVPAELLAQPEPDRAAVAVRAQGVPGFDVLRGLRALHHRHRSLPGRLAHGTQGRDGNTTDTQVSDVWRCATVGRVEYKLLAMTPLREGLEAV